MQDTDVVPNHHTPSHKDDRKALRVPVPIPPRAHLGGRSSSTTVRLREQGLTRTKSSSGEFALCSIRKGSDDWSSLIKPFVSDLAFRSLSSRRYQSELTFRPYTSHAAVLFCDLSSYSKITAAIAHRGAHFLSSVVNAYLSRLLDIVRDNGGDVVKFAGDAVLIVWEGMEEDLATNVLCAARCVLQMQHQAGKHAVPDTDLAFRIHCGLACGMIESEIFRTPVHENMQRLYHYCGGETLEEICDLVDLAKSGQVCISTQCVNIIGDRGTFKSVSDNRGIIGPKVLESMELSRMDEMNMEDYLDQAMADRHMRRNKAIEEDFIHPAVLRFLSHGGLSPTQVAQNRDLCCLFIAMTANQNAVNWLTEVQQVLDNFRCPIVQILYDDKGVHIVAAVNLYEAVPEGTLLGLKVCKELVEKQVGCAIGMARGACFCGVTGSSSVACRWDITGPPAVRAARLMQHALDHQVEVALDQSVYDDPLAVTRTVELHSGVRIKGAPDLCHVYTLSGSSNSAAFRLLETVHPKIHNEKVRLIHSHIASDKTRSAVLITGPPDSSKKIVALRAAGCADLVPFQHNCGGKNEMLELARTMALWYSYVDLEEVRNLAESVLEQLRHQRLSRAHDECVRLVNTAIKAGLRGCFVVNRVQHLDEFSFSLIRECLHGQRKVTRHSSNLTRAVSLSSMRSSSSLSLGGSPGQISFLCVHCGLYNSLSPADVVEQITRRHRRLCMPVVNIRESSKEDLHYMFQELWGVRMTDRALTTFAEDSGYCAGYFGELTVAVRKLSSKEWCKGNVGFVELNEDYTIDIPRGSMRSVRNLKVMQVSSEVTMRIAKIYDDLPPVFQVFCRILALSNQKEYFKLPRNTMWEVINDIVAEGVDAELMQVILDEMVDMCLLKIEKEYGEQVLSFQSLALADIALDVCTPIQVDTISKALIDRLDRLSLKSFKIPLVLAELHGRQIDPDNAAQICRWERAYKAFQDESSDMDENKIKRWNELFEEKIIEGGFSAAEVLKTTLVCPEGVAVPACSDLKLLQIYRAPIAFGPMGHSISCICHNTFQEMTTFHGRLGSTSTTLSRDTDSASKRYLSEVKALEGFLETLDLNAPDGMLETERRIIELVAKPAVCADDVKKKAALLVHEYIPIAGDRLQRVHEMIHKVRRDDESLPDVLHSAPRVFRRAYEALLWDISSNRTDAAQDSIMVLATHNYKPKPLPEHLPTLYYQTVARIRNRVLSRTTDSENMFFRHEHSVDDLEAFLLVTPLLYQTKLLP